MFKPSTSSKRLARHVNSNKHIFATWTGFTTLHSRNAIACYGIACNRKLAIVNTYVGVSLRNGSLPIPSVGKHVKSTIKRHYAMMAALPI